MHHQTVFAGLFTTLFHLSSSAALPVASGVPMPMNRTGYDVNFIASEIFPGVPGDLSRFDVDVRYFGLDAATQSWLGSLNPAAADSNETKAQLITAAAYATPFDPTNAGMAEDVHKLLVAVEGNVTTQTFDRRSKFLLGAGHAISWSACAAFLSCVSGTTCKFDITIDQAPRSHCEKRATSNCCVSWSKYSVRAGFFTTTWTTCNDEVEAQGRDKVSCEGYDGTGAQGGDVCYSDRPKGCT